MSTDTVAPIIIKRKKVSGGDGHHGGAWKVAYADFVTAMMAFFMLMWLLNATTEQQRKGLADYFTPTIAVNRVSGGGDGALGGDSVMTSSTLAESGSGGIGEQEGNGEIDSAQLAAEAADLTNLQSELLGLSGEAILNDEALSHIVTRVTDEGLVIEIFDRPDASLFYDETDAPKAVTVEIAALLARLLQDVTNQIAIEGHVQAQSVLRLNNTVWDLSTSRASRMRLLLEDGGLMGTRIARLTGKGDRLLAVPDPRAERNNRLEVIVLRAN